MRDGEGAADVLDGGALVKEQQEKGSLRRAVQCCREAEVPEPVCKLLRGLLDLRLPEPSN